MRERGPSAASIARGLVDGSPDALVAVSLEGEILFWSWGAEMVFGRGAADVAGRPLPEIVARDAGRGPLLAALAEARDTGWAVVEGLAVRPDGGEICFEGVLRRVAGEGGEDWLSFSAKDVSERVRLVREAFERNFSLEGSLAQQNAALRDQQEKLLLTVARLEQSESEAQKIARREQEMRHRVDSALAELKAAQTALVKSERLAAVGELAANVAHELRNPLAAVRNAIHYVGKRNATSGGDARVAEILRVADLELAACSRIIGDLVEFARERPLTLAPCTLEPLVTGAIAGVTARGGISITTAFESELPLSLLDGRQIERVITALVQNAVDAVPSERDGVVLVRVLQDGPELRVQVEDNGRGIAPEDMPRIFEPFFTTKLKGTGLGLPIARRTVTRHGGRIDVRSRPGEGTCFDVTLPILGLATEQTQDAAARRDGGNNEPSRRPG